MHPNSRVKRTAVPTEDPDITDNEAGGVELYSTNKTRNDINDEEKKLRDNTGDEVPPKLNLPNASEFVATELEKNTKRIMFPAFTITIIISAILLILYPFNWINDKYKQDFIGLIIILIITIITAIIAMFGVYKWGEAEAYIEFYAQQNEEYKNNTSKLQSTREKMKNQVEEMQKSVDNLQDETVELKHCLESFDELKEALSDIVGEDEEILQLVDGLNRQYSEIKTMALQKDKAQLLLTYYKMLFGGANRKRFEKEDYQRFLGRLNSSTRELYDNLGGFDAMDVDKDGNVDPEEFMSITEKVLENTEDAFIALVNQQK